MNRRNFIQGAVAGAAMAALPSVAFSSRDEDIYQFWLNQVLKDLADDFGDEFVAPGTTGRSLAEEVAQFNANGTYRGHWDTAVR